MLFMMKRVMKNERRVRRLKRRMLLQSSSGTRDESSTMEEDIKCLNERRVRRFRRRMLRSSGIKGELVYEDVKCLIPNSTTEEETRSDKRRR